MSRTNRLWGTERIRGELLKLGVIVSIRSIRRYRWRGPGSSPSQSWRTFLANHAYHLWAAALFTVTTLTFKTLYAERVIGTLRRECLDHMIVLHQQHLQSVLSEYVGYYNQDRLHRTLGLRTPNRGHTRPPIESGRAPCYTGCITFTSAPPERVTF